MSGKRVDRAGPPPPRPPPGSSARWPNTPWWLVRDARGAAGSERRAAVERLLELYYLPVQRFFARVLGVTGSVAEDVAHDFFVQLLERDFVDGLRHETSLRGFLKLACSRHYANWLESEAALRRALPRAETPADEALDGAALGGVVDEELRRFYVEEALRRLRDDCARRGCPELLAIFEARTRTDGSAPEGYAAIAARFGLKVFDVQNRLVVARNRFRRELLQVVAERAEDPQAELRELGLGRLVGKTWTRKSRRAGR